MVARTWSGSTTQRHEMSHGTYLVTGYPWGVNLDARVLCSDGVARKVKRISETADTFFSIPSAVEVTYKGKRYTVAGYITTDKMSRNSNSLNVWGENTYIFRPYLYRKNGNVLPKWVRRDVNPNGVN